MCKQTLFRYEGCKCKGADKITSCSKPKHPPQGAIDEQTNFRSEGCKYYEPKDVKFCEQPLCQYEGPRKCKRADEIKICSKPKPPSQEEVNEQITCTFPSEGRKYHGFGKKVYVIDAVEVTPSDRRYLEEEKCSGVHLVRDLVPRFGSCESHTVAALQEVVNNEKETEVSECS